MNTGFKKAESAHCLTSPKRRLSGTRKRNLLAIIAICVAGMHNPSQGAELLMDLFASVPEPPVDAAEAMTWVAEGRIVEPRLLDALARIEARKAALRKTAALGTSPSTPSPGSVQAALLSYRAYTAEVTGGQAPAQALEGRRNWLSNRFDALRLSSPADPQSVAELRRQELAAYTALYADWKPGRLAAIRRADVVLASIENTDAVPRTQDREEIHAYELALISEIEALATLCRHAALTTAGINTVKTDPAETLRPATTLWDLMRNPVSARN